MAMHLLRPFQIVTNELTFLFTTSVFFSYHQSAVLYIKFNADHSFLELCRKVLIMQTYIVLLVLFAAIFCDANSVQTFGKHERLAEPMFEEKYFDQIIDHLNFNSHGNKTYKQRYLITGE